MADGISTRLQREVTQHQKELERLEAKMDESVNSLRQDMENKNAEVKLMFEQLTLKMEGLTTGKVVVEIPVEAEKSKAASGPCEGNSSKTTMVGGNLDLSRDGSCRMYKQGRLDCPHFDGIDFSRWMLKMDQYFEAERVRDDEKV